MRQQMLKIIKRNLNQIQEEKKKRGNSKKKRSKEQKNALYNI